MEVTDQLNVPENLSSLKKPSYQLDRRLGLEEYRKISSLAENRTPAVQPVTLRYTD
jgi:hypothetical protein